jgi:transaldolase
VDWSRYGWPPDDARRKTQVARTVDADAGEAEKTLAKAADAGIDLAAVTAELEREGVESFCDSYHQLLARVASKVGRARAAQS